MTVYFGFWNFDFGLRPHVPEKDPQTRRGGSALDAAGGRQAVPRDGPTD